MHARECLRICTDQAADAFERFYAHEIIVVAARAARDARLAQEHRGYAEACWAAIDDADSCAGALKDLERLGATAM